MAVVLRNGSYGQYYASESGSSAALTEAQMKVNATYIYGSLTDYGFTVNSIAAMLGNMESESTINPGRWQSDDVGNTGLGYGLVQWTPATNYLNWVTSIGAAEPEDMDVNIGRIIYEKDHGLQYYPTNSYPETFSEFATSTKSPSYLAVAFLRNYERAGVEVVDERIANANKWYTYLTGIEPPEGGGGDNPNPPVNPGGSSKKKKGFNFVLFSASKKRLRGML